MDKRFEKKIYMGIVEDNYDPNRKGRIKVRVQSLYNVIPTENIPYASPFMDIAGKEYKVPAVGKIVNVLFLSNDIYDPLYIYAENYNINLENKLSSLSNDEYINFVALLFDERTQISADSEELTIDHFYNKITINKESINHELKDNTQKLNLGDRSAGQDVVLGNHWFDWFDKFVDKLIQPTSLLGNMSAPVIKPEIDALLTEYKAIRTTFVSNHVKVVDNNQVTKLERSPKTDTAKEDKDLIDNTYDTNTNSQELQSRIEQENKKSCQNENESKPTSQLPQPESETHEGDVNFIPKEGSYEKRIINGEIYIVTDKNRTEIDNYEKSIEAENQLKKLSPTGDYKGQGYYIDGEQNQKNLKNKTYNPQEISKIEIPTPTSVGKFPTYLYGNVVNEINPVVKINGKLVISKYYSAYTKMAMAAKNDGATLILNGAFRKYEEQMNLRIQNSPPNKKNDLSFLETANSTKFKPYTGRPGWSHHHYGNSFDISTNGGKNKAYKWLEKNALAFGFIRTVKSETWHWEYEPWTIMDIKANDKYAKVPKGHSSWNKDIDDEDFINRGKNNTIISTPNTNNREC